MAKMRAVLLLLTVASVLPAQKDPMQLYQQGRYAEAVHAFRKALEDDKGDPLLNYNLAVSLWRQGEADEAETAAEKTATLSEGRLDALRDGILGNLRFEAALKKAAEQTKGPRSKILEAAVDLMVQARKHYQRGAVRPGAGPALARNLERAIRKEEELRKQLEEEKKKEEEQKKNDKKKNDRKKDQKDKDKKDKKEQDKKQQQQKDQQQKDQQQKDQQQKDQKKQDQKKQQPQQPKKQPLGKFDPKKQLTKEQKQRLLERLKEIEAQLRQLQKQKQADRPKVKKDW
jgi:Ca-activated chloride channel homolog